MIYVYKCRECGVTGEYRHGMTEEPPAYCDYCGGDLRRVYQVPQVVYYGSGFHCNDYGTRFKVDTT